MSLRLCFWVRGLLATSILSWQGMGTALIAQDVPLSVTILIVDEEWACRPSGYKNYATEPSHTKRNCHQLTVLDVTNMMRRYAHSAGIRIPPQEISIGSELLPSLNGYIRRMLDNRNLKPEMRKSAVFLFDWGAPQDFKLSFQRLSSSPKIPSSEMVTAQMQGQRRWIYHERADSLAPGYDVVWELRMPDKTLHLRTIGGSNGP